MSTLMTAFLGEYNRMKARSFGYEGVTVAGIAVVARDTGALLLAQRAVDKEDAPEVAETWEFPGGHLDDGEEPFAGAVREFTEEIGVPLPEGEVVHGWRAGDDGHYQGFVYAVAEEFDVGPDTYDPDEVQDVLWVTPEGAATLNLRPEVAKIDLAALVQAAVSGNEEAEDMAEDTEVTEVDEDALEALFDEEPALTMLDVIGEAIPVHGIMAPEDTESGDERGFVAGAVTTRPLGLPFMWQEAQVPGHDGAFVIGSVDRVMRKDNRIHWEGSLLTSQKAADFVELLVHFGRFGVSIDGDKGSLDEQMSADRGGTWFDAVRVAGLTAVSIPAFHEAYVALGPHPEMPNDAALVASLHQSGDLIGGPAFDRGPGWVTNPKETKRLHDYWTKKGQPGYEKIAWGTGGDYRRCVALVGEKIAKNSPTDLRFIKQICAQWHHDALGYWPGQANMPGNPTTEEIRERYESSLDNPDIEPVEADAEGESAKWEAVLVSSVSGNRVLPPLSYFHRVEDAGALTIEEPDEKGIRRVYGYAAYWGVCHVGMDGVCVEPPRTYSDDYPEFHLGRTKTEEGYVYTGVLTYGVGHRDAKTILSESPDQAYFDNVNNAWAAVRVGEDDTGIWFSGVVLPGVPEDHLVKIEASGQVSGEWRYGAMRACLTVNVPGYPVERPTAEYDAEGNVLALAASAFGGVDSPCEPTPKERMAALAAVEAQARMERLRKEFNWVDIAEELVAEAQDEGRVNPVGLREDGAIVYEKDGEIPGTDTIVEPMPEEG